MRSMSRLPDRIPPGPIKLTYEDYVDLPDDGRRYEILDGELEVSPAPAPMHQGVSRNLLVILHDHVRERGLGSVYYAPIDVILANTTIAQPDLVFVARGRESIISKRGIEGSSRSGRRDPLSLVGPPRPPHEGEALRALRHPRLLGRGSRGADTRVPRGGG